MAETRQVAVRVTLVGVDPQDATVDGVTVRLTFEVPLLAVRVKPVRVGWQVKESALLPEPLIAGNVIVRGFVDQRALGAELGAPLGYLQASYLESVEAASVQ